MAESPDDKISIWMLEIQRDIEERTKEIE